jgi:enoyl-CoA hydratase/carnithine racemase
MARLRAWDSPDVEWGAFPVFPAVSTQIKARSEGLIERRLEAAQSLVVSKLAPGFDDECVEGLRRIVDEVAAGRRGALKFLVFDFAHHMTRDSEAGEGFGRLINAVANLVVKAPIVAVASVRADLTGADLDLALACNLIMAEAGRQFSFGADPTVSLATYGFLSQKIGFVRAEKLMEGGAVLDAEQMHDLLLVKTVMPDGAGFAGIEQQLTRSVRRHNSTYGIYRAQRITHPALTEVLDEARIA